MTRSTLTRFSALLGGPPGLLKISAFLGGATIIGAALAVHPATANIHPVQPNKNCSSNSACILGNNSSRGPGVEGLNTGFGNGVYGQGANNDGVNGTTTNPSSKQRARSGVFGSDASTDGGTGNVGVAGGSAHGNGVEASTTDGIALNILSGSGTPIVVTNSNTTRTLLFDSSGNLTIYGRIFTSGKCHAGCSSTRRVVAYTPRETMPTIEDFGEGRLVNGRGVVMLDPAFVNTIEDGQMYEVFITPEGNSHGLYVTGKTSRGFTVNENQGGTSSLAFSYRVLAKPLGSAGTPRLPIVTMSGSSKHV